jgi:D-galactarolactone isomerase
MPSTDGQPRLKAPPDTCDTHMHVYDPRFPFAPGAKITHPGASVADYRAMCEQLGIERTVVVQPSAYGFDNSCTLDAVAQMGERARGIATVDPAIPDAELDRLDEAGVRGTRYFMLPGGNLTWDSLEPMAARMAELGWHVQLQLDGRTLPEHFAMLHRLPATLVIDHVGKFLEPVAPDHPSFRALLRLVGNGHTYVKLSAPYETSKSGPPNYDDVGTLAKALVRAAPDRMVWATNWPHPMHGHLNVDNAALLDLLLDWVPDEATRRKVLVDNPARLYGF